VYKLLTERSKWPHEELPEAACDIFKLNRIDVTQWKRNPSWEANSHTASQIPRHLRKPKFHYRVHKSPLLVLPWTRFIQPTHYHPTFLHYTL